MSISVIIPSFNSGDFIGDAIASVLSQPADIIEVVVQDGGSKDATAEVVGALDDPRVSLHQEPDRGQTDALNKALRRARGDWILWMNADDLLLPGALGHVRHALDDDLEMVYGDYVAIDEAGDPLKSYASSREFTRERLLVHGCYVFSGTCLFRRKIFSHLGLFDESLEYSMDYEFYLRIAPVVRARHCGEEVACFRWQPESKTMSRPWGQWRENAELIWRYGRSRPRLLTMAAITHGATAGYLLTRPVWQSNAWRRIRPAKRLGGSRSAESSAPR